MTNNAVENYVKWEPLPDIPANLFSDGLHDDWEGFRILLRGDDTTKGVLRIAFDKHVAYRNIDEGDRLKTLSSISEPAKSSLYIVENSKWIHWFCKESLGVYQPDSLVHYAIFGADDCIDVLAYPEPKVEWL